MTFSSPNQLLRSLGQHASAAFILEHLSPVNLPIGRVLFETRSVPQHIHFITSGFASIVAPMTNGEAIEVGMVGPEGFAESVFLLGGAVSPLRCFMQSNGNALRMDFEQFRDVFLKDAVIRQLVLRYVQYELLVSRQLTACNRLHEVVERLARWLLMAEDRLTKPTIHLTQDFLAEMLGAHRPTVSITEKILQRAGLIDYTRGVVTITDRPGLEEVACECYPVIRDLLASLYSS